MRQTNIYIHTDIQFALVGLCLEAWLTTAGDHLFNQQKLSLFDQQ